MQLTRIELRHWRRHAHLVVDDLAERITLISGPNEAGKSTIAEALRFALFEPSKPVYDARKALQPRGGGEAPEVEVALRIDGGLWRIAKRFLKRQTTRLVGPDGAASEGEEAERRIQQLLGISLPESGRVTRDVDLRHLGWWPVLWLRQGELSGLDAAVTEGVRGKLSDLVAQEVGAVAAGPLAARALAAAQREHARFWTDVAGRPTGDYAAAQQERDAAAAARDAARQRMQAFETAVRELQGITDRLGGLAPRLRAAQDQADAARARAVQAAQRRHEVERQAGQLAELRRAAAALDAQRARLAELEAGRAQVAAAIVGADERAAALAAAAERADAERLRSELAAAAAQNALAEAVAAAERAQAAAERAALAATIDQRAARLERIQRLHDAHARASAALAAAPAIAPAALAALRRAADAHRDACLRRDAAATAVRIAAERPLVLAWTADGRSERIELPAAGEADLRTTGIAELHLEGIASIRVRIGDGAAADLAAAAQSAGEALDRALRAARVDSPAAAETAVQERSAAAAAASAAAAALAAAVELPAAASAAALDAAIADVQRQLAADRARLAAAGPVASASEADPGAARAALRAAQAAAEDARQAASAAAAAAAGQRERLAASRSAADAARERSARIAAELARLPPAADLDRQRAAAAAGIADAINREAELRDAWEQLGGDEAQAAADAQAQVVERLRDEVAQARGQREGLLGRIRAVADQDPAAALQEAEAALDRSAQRLDAIARQARAARVLRDALLHVQREARAALAAPVRAAIGPYLRRIFPRADLLLGEDDWTMAGLAGADAPAEPFAQLSLGAKEQFALLVRLGLAEVLAQGRRLPLVLDDPLTNADPPRRQAMIAALRHAARKLQIILFTCHEAEHDGLAAERIISLPGGR